MSNNTAHRGQLQVVEGSSVGEFYVATRFDYDSSMNLIYLGESKLNKPDNENCYHIQKFIYDAFYNLIEIRTASNLTTTNSTLVSITSINTNPSIVQIDINGTFDECNENDSFKLTTITQSICGKITQIISSTRILVLVDNASPIINEINTIITNDKLTTLLLNDKTKDYIKRQWVNRDRYIYI